MRERVAFLIEQKVEKRVQEHMAVFREEVARELEDQRQANEHHIAYYMDPNARMVNPLNKYRQSMHNPSYPYAAPHPQNPRGYKLNASLSPVRYRNEFGLDQSRY